jgi:hypothetical protein
MQEKNLNMYQEGQHGATVSAFYVEREVKVFALHEYEVDNLSSLNADSSTFFSLGSILITLGLSIKINAIFYADLTPEGHVAEAYAFPILLFVGVVFVLVGVRAVYKRASILSKIKNQSRLTGSS